MWLVTIVVMMTVVPSIRGDCPAVDPKCECRGVDIIFCKDLGDVSRVPQFKHSNTVYDKLEISGKTKLSTVPTGSFNGLKVKEIRLENIGITAIQAGAFSDLNDTLEILYLDLNQLETIPEDAFQGINLLKTLWLHNNRLKTLSYALVQNKPHLESLTLYGNPLECDCRLAWVRKMAHMMSADHTALCASPPPVEGSRVVVYDISMCAATTTETGIS